jgi:hypothetical protein
MIIGALYNDSDKYLVDELLRLLEIPWYRYEHNSPDVIISFGQHRVVDISTEASICFERFPLSSSELDRFSSKGFKSYLRFGDKKVPIYCGTRNIQHTGQSLLEDQSGDSIGQLVDRKGVKSVIFGYDLLAEMEFLLTIGQPEECAAIPSLDFHLDILRDALSRVLNANPLLTNRKTQSILVLTHDIDSPFLRPHFFDVTFAGIVARGLVNMFGTTEGARDVRKALVESMKHCLGWGPDPLEGLPTCLDIEKALGVSSTYFVVSRHNSSGRVIPLHKKSWEARIMRGVKYGEAGLLRVVDPIKKSGDEIALHGIDTWISYEYAITERHLLEEINIFPKGHRTHWLFWDKRSPKVLAAAGFTYDSSMGFDSAIGYRCGTAKPFQFPGILNLWELPLIVMDIALFSKEKVSPNQVVERVLPYAEHISKHGGVLTINWHDRAFSQVWHRGEHYKYLLLCLLEKNFIPFTAMEAIRCWAKEQKLNNLLS